MRLYQRENGVHYVEFARGKAKSLKTKDPLRAQIIFKKLERADRDNRANQHEKTTRITLKQFKQEYISTREGVLADNTVRIDGESIDKLINFIGGESLTLNVVTPLEAAKFVGYLSKQGLAPSSINITIRHLKAAWKKAVKWYSLRENSFAEINEIVIEDDIPKALTLEGLNKILYVIALELEGIKKRIPEVIKGRMRPSSFVSYMKIREKIASNQNITDREKAKINTYEEFLVKVEERILEDQELILSYLYTAGRRTETAVLRWQDFQEVSIPDAESPRQFKKVWQVKLWKTKVKNRIIPVASKLQSILFYRKKDMGPVFPFHSSRPKEASRTFQYYATKAGVEGTLHSLRHTAAVFMLLNGVPMKIVSKILGHSSVKTTEIYTKLVTEQLREGIDALNF